MASRISINGGPWQPLYSPIVEKTDLFCHWCGFRCEAIFRTKTNSLVLCHKKWCKKQIRPLLKELMKKSKSA